MNDAPAIKNSLGFLWSQKHISQKQWLLLSVIYLVLAIFSWALSYVVDESSWWAHGLWCIFGSIVIFPILYKVIKSDVSTVISDHRIMLVSAFLLYFLIGASILAFGPEDEVNISQRYYPITVNDALRVNFINSLGLSITIFSATWFSGKIFSGGVERATKLFAKIPIHWVLLLFFILGLIGFISVITRDLRLTYVVLPGSISQLSMLLIFSIFIGSAFVGKYSSPINILALFTTFLMVAMGLVLFNKSMLYLPMLAYFSGLNVRTKSPKYLLYGVLAVGLTFSSVGDLVSYGRMKSGGPSDSEMTVGERMDVVKNYVEGSRIIGMDDYSAWARLSYTVPQTAALDFYNQGNGGNGASLVPWLFVPRIIAPQKPVITQSGTEFNYKVAGSYGSSTGMGLFVSGYYNLGWLGFIFASIFCGWYLSQSSYLSRLFISRNALLLLPLGLLGLYAAFRIDGEIIADFMGTYVYLLYALFAFYIMPFRIKK